MKDKMSLWFKILYIFLVTIFIIFMLSPIAWSFIMSITPQVEILSNTTNYFPENPTLENYKSLFSLDYRKGDLFRRGIINSIVAAAISLFFGIPIAILCAYPMSRLKFSGFSVFRNVLLFTMAIPVFATIIPLYKIFATFNFLDNIFALVLVYITSFLPLAVWLLINYFDTLPKELEEAAYIDGYTKFKTMILVILPVSYPIIFASALIIFLTTWNQFQIPLILAPSQSTKPIAVVVSEFVTKSTVEYGLMNAGGILAIFPPAIIALVFRKFLIKGMVGGATKG